MRLLPGVVRESVAELVEHAIDVAVIAEHCDRIAIMEFHRA
jgi:hypothetical protein